MINDATLSALRNFFGGYFHEDWDLEADDPDNIVRAYIRDSGDTPQELQALGQGILNYIRDVEDAELDRRLDDELGCYYDPHADGLSAREWLRKVASMLMENDKPS